MPCRKPGDGISATLNFKIFWKSMLPEPPSCKCLWHLGKMYSHADICKIPRYTPGKCNLVSMNTKKIQVATYTYFRNSMGNCCITIVYHVIKNTLCILANTIHVTYMKHMMGRLSFIPVHHLQSGLPVFWLALFSMAWYKLMKTVRIMVLVFNRHFPAKYTVYCLRTQLASKQLFQ